MHRIAGIGLDPITGRALDLRRGHHLTPDVRGGERPGQAEPRRTRLVDHRRWSGQGPHPRDDLFIAGFNRSRNTSPVTPSIAAATTDRVCTSRPTLVRSVDTGGFPHMQALPNRSLLGNPRDCVSEAPA